jgi:hypothetical protein
MNIDLRPSPCSAVGVLDQVWQCEFQIGSRLIDVEHRNDEAPCVRISAAQSVINAVWDDLPGALTFAERHCEAQMPELMRLCEIHVHLKNIRFPGFE